MAASLPSMCDVPFFPESSRETIACWPMSLRRRSLLGQGRIHLCVELPLFKLPARDRLGVQTIRRYRARKLRITQGEDSVLIFGDERASHDVHCKLCGSLMFSVVRNGEYVHVTLGTLTDTPTIRPNAHIFVGSKAPWYSITDELPQHDEFE
ncbi:GFA family protein [Paraburkholderia sp.]|uniref:GFA family protein n=1 Tax=Paraburkholderia sp. TaxID=1926495 RepID=UPI0039E4669F